MKAALCKETVFYEEKGQGPAIILLHGFPLDHRMWQEQADALQNIYRVITHDLRGMGQSAVPEDTLTLDRYADDVLELMDRLGIERAALAGFSMGGYVAFSLLRKAPDRFNALILLNTRPEADPQEGRINRMNMAAALLRNGSAAASEAMLPKLLSEQTRRERPEFVKKLNEWMLSMHPNGLVHASLAMAFRKDSVSLLPTIAVPTLIIGGELDSITTPEVMKRMAEQIKSSRYVIIPGAAHLTVMEKSAEVNEAILQFLQGLS